MASYEEQRDRLVDILADEDRDYISEIYDTLGVELNENGEEDLNALADAILSADEQTLRYNPSIAELLNQALSEEQPEELEREELEELDEEMVDTITRINEQLSVDQQRAILEELIANNFVAGDIDENNPDLVAQALADTLLQDVASLEELVTITQDEDVAESIRTLLDLTAEGAEELPSVAQQPQVQQPVVRQQQVQQPASQQAMYPTTPSTPIQNAYQVASSRVTPVIAQQPIVAPRITPMVGVRTPAIQQPQIVQAQPQRAFQPILQRNASVTPIQFGTRSYVPATPQARPVIQPQQPQQQMVVQEPVQVEQPSAVEQQPTQPIQGGRIPTLDQLVSNIGLAQLREYLRRLDPQAKPGRSKASAAEAILNLLNQDPSLLNAVPEISNLGTSTAVKPPKASTKPAARPPAKQPTQPVQPVIRQQGIVALSPAFQPSRVMPQRPPVTQPISPAMRVQPPITQPLVRQPVVSPARRIQQPTSPAQRNVPSGITLTAVENIRDAELRDLYKAVTGKTTAPRKKTERAAEIFNIVNSGLADQRTLDLVNQAIATAGPPKTAPKTPGRTPKTPKTPVVQQPVQQQPTQQPQQLTGVQPIQQVVRQPDMSLAQRYINALQVEPAVDIISKLGMVVPPNLDPEQYLRDNIADYLTVIGRSNVGPLTPLDVIQDPSNAIQHLSQYADYEFFQNLGVYVPYQSRRELVENLANLGVRDNFFVPLVRNCRNELLSTGLPSSDPNVEVIAYGTLLNYECYNPQTLLDGIVREGQGTAYNVFIEGPNGEEFYGEQLQRLMDLSRVYPALAPLYEALTM